MSVNTVIKDYISGYISGVSAILVTHPIDTIKTNYQNNKKTIFNLRNLYKGIKAPLIGIGLEKALVFGTYDLFYNKTNSYALSGAVSGFTASFIVTPYERVKILMQSNQNVVKQSSFKSNISYMFKGLTATFYREVPGFTIYFSIYHNIKDQITKNRQYGNIKPYESFLLGGLAGSISWVFIYPQDLVKTRMQSCNLNTKKSFLNILSSIVKEKGIRGLYNGFNYALLRAVPLHATAFMVNEYCKQILY